MPLIMSFGADSSENKIRCLEMEADDFVTKLFNLRKVAARVNCVLRRANENDPKNFNLAKPKSRAA